MLRAWRFTISDVMYELERYTLNTALLSEMKSNKDE